METRIGRIFSFDAERKFGFIQETETGESHFFHWTDLNGQPVPIRGSLVRFQIGTFRGRQKATNIRLATAEELPGGVK